MHHVDQAIVLPPTPEYTPIDPEANLAVFPSGRMLHLLDWSRLSFAARARGAGQLNAGLR